MNMPGFTAEASLLNSDKHYQATTAATVYGGFVQPALFRLRFDELYVPKPIFCLKPPPCFYDAFGRQHCLPPSLGIWNPVTYSCE